MKRSKRYRELAAKVPKEPVALGEAVQLLRQCATTRFDQTVEVAVRLGIDQKQADQRLRGSLVLPHGIGKAKRVAVFAKGDLATVAQEAGADVVGQEDLAERIKGGWLEFDACIATPDMMGVVGPLGRVLGPRGLMPSPRAGTVTTDVARVVQEYKAGKVEFRTDDAGIVHAPVGKLSFDDQKLEENIRALVQHLVQIRPQAVKGTYVRSVAISATMSPGIPVAA